MKHYFIVTKDAVDIFRSQMHPGLANYCNEVHNPIVIYDESENDLETLLNDLNDYGVWAKITESDYKVITFFKTANHEDIIRKFL